MNARVPVTALGSIVAQDMIKSLKLASKTGRVKYNIIAAHMSPRAAGLYRCDARVQVPPVSSPDYVDAIVIICEKMSAQPVFCGSDDELLALTSTKGRIEKTGAKLLTGSLEVLAVARDKWGVPTSLAKQITSHALPLPFSKSVKSLPENSAIHL